MKQHYFLSILLLSVLSICNAFATDYYIDPNNGNDWNNGLSSNSAFRSLYKIDSINLQPGDTVYFMEGTYQRSGQTLLKINESGTADNYITFTNFEDHTPVLEFDSWTGIDIIGGSSYIKIDGLHIKGARSRVNLESALNQGASCGADFAGGTEGIYNGTGILAVGPNLKWSDGSTYTVPHHISITNCHVYDCTSSGIAFQQADYVTITNNKVYNNCWYTIYGTSGINLYQFVNTDGTTGFHNEVSGNLIYGNQLFVPQVPYCTFWDGNGFIIDDFKHVQTANYKDASAGFDAYSAKTLIANNISVENGGSGLHFFLSSHCYIYNNTVANNAFQNGGDNGNGEIRIGICDDFEVKNNIFRSDTKVHWNSDNINLDYTNNFHFGPLTYKSLSGENCESCVEGVDVDFANTNVDAEQPYITNFLSPGTNAGVELTTIINDYSGIERPYDGLYDIGAYELRDEDACENLTWFADFDNDGLGDANDSIEACEQPEGYVAESGDLCPADTEKIAPGECGCGKTEDSCVEECEELVWYADFDNDGLGDINDSIEACEQPEGYVAESGDLCPADTEKITPGECGCGKTEDSCVEECEELVWYADFDNDGYGDANDTLINCEQPEGYVADNSDLCPNDTQKTNPGECGCGETEGTCNEPEDICDSPEYSRSAIYPQAGTTVIYNGKVYQNKWYTSGQLPTSGGPWEMIDFCDNSGSDCSSIASWSASEVYPMAGNQVVYNSKIYENKWYISGGIPDANAAWKLIGFCATANATAKTTYQVDVHDLSGNALLNTQSSSTIIDAIDMSNLDSGIYIIHFTNLDTGEIAVEKISR